MYYIIHLFDIDLMFACFTVKSLIVCDFQIFKFVYFEKWIFILKMPSNEIEVSYICIYLRHYIILCSGKDGRWNARKVGTPLTRGNRRDGSFSDSLIRLDLCIKVIQKFEWCYLKKWELGNHFSVFTCLISFNRIIYMLIVKRSSVYEKRFWSYFGKQEQRLKLCWNMHSSYIHLIR